MKRKRIKAIRSIARAHEISVRELASELNLKRSEVRDVELEMELRIKREAGNTEWVQKAATSGALDQVLKNGRARRAGILFVRDEAQALSKQVASLEDDLERALIKGRRISDILRSADRDK